MIILTLLALGFAIILALVPLVMAELGHQELQEMGIRDQRGITGRLE